MRIIQATIFIILALALGEVSLAQSERYTLDIRSQPIKLALRDLGEQTGIQILFRAEDVAREGVTTPRISGELSPKEALDRMLEQAPGLKYEWMNAHTVLVSAKEGAGAEKAALMSEMGAVRVAQGETASDGAGASASKGGGEGNSNPTGSREDAEGMKLEEVVVTAQKRKEKIQDVPFGISALSTESLERNGISGAEGYLAVVPGVHYNSFGRGRSTIVIRGVSTENVGVTSGSNPTNQGATEIYLDEIPLTDRFGAWTNPDPDTFDIERVEVLRGPQGTLFGSGSLGGAVRLITNKPNLSDFQSKFELGVENTDGGDDGNSAAAMVNLPLVSDKLALRVAASRKKVGGYIDSIVTLQDDINSEENEVVRAILGYQPTEALTVQLTGMYEDQRLDGNVTSFRRAEDGGPYEFDADSPEYSTARQRILSATIGYDFGGVNLTSTSAYAERDSFLLNDWGRLLGLAFGLGFDPDTALVYRTQDSQRFAQEIRLSSAADTRLQWTVGGFFLHTKQQFRSFWRTGVAGHMNPLFPDCPATGCVLVDAGGEGDIQEYAAFGEASYHLSDRFIVTAGARWFNSTVESCCSPSVDTTDSALTPKLSLSFHPTGDVHLYATASKGYRIGLPNGNNQFNPTVPPAAGPDSLWNYEIGIKSSWLDRRLQANVTGYYIDWTNIQLTTFLYDDNGQVFASDHTANAGDARIKGVEAELTLRPVGGIEFGTSLAYTDTELTSVDPTIARQGIVPGGRLPGSAEYTATTYIQYDGAIGSNLQGYVRLTDQRVGGVMGRLNPAVDPLTNTGPWHRLDLRSGIRWDSYELALSVQNLANDDAIVQGGGGGSPFFGYYSYPVTRLRPRTVGLTFRADFK